jgi:hypothetical protein
MCEIFGEGRIRIKDIMMGCIILRKQSTLNSRWRKSLRNHSLAGVLAMSVPAAISTKVLPDEEESD